MREPTVTIPIACVWSFQNGVLKEKAAKERRTGEGEGLNAGVCGGRKFGRARARWATNWRFIRIKQGLIFRVAFEAGGAGESRVLSCDC